MPFPPSNPGSPAVVPASVVVVGSVNADIVTRVAAHAAPGETVLGDSVAVLAGGKGANQAVAAARLGARVTMVGAVGDDAFAEAALTGLRASGVELSAVDVVPGPTGIAIVTVAADGENTIVVVPGANGSVDAAAVRRWHQVVARAGVVVLQGEIPRSGIEEAARLARGRVVLNLAPVVRVDARVVRAADPLIVNEHEALRVLGMLDDDPPAPGTPHESVVARLRELGVPSVVLTRGARGALVAAGGDRTGAGPGVVDVPAPGVRAVDTTGAGDAFTGALAYRLAAGDTLLDAARFAVRVGAYAVTGAGAQPSYPGASDTLPG